jgi:RNA 3'-terminal phosphate cyclase (ATP)
VERIVIDGSAGEGGGQIVRTALALSLVTRTPIRIERVRAGRAKPGLMRQHLTCVHAAAAIGEADVRGAEVGSLELDFTPRALVGGAHRFSIGTAGSTTLVVQTVLPALFAASVPSSLVLEGGTHNPLAPTFDFLDRVYLPLLRRTGLRATATLERHGFYPAGGGRLRIDVEPGVATHALHLHERGPLVQAHARATFAGLPFDVARRELDVVTARLGWEGRPHEVRAAGAGNVLQLEVEHEHVTELFTAFGERGMPAEEVARLAVDEAVEYLASTAPVGSHLADQLLVPLAIQRAGSFRTLPLTLHTQTQLQLIPRFLDVRLRHEGDTIGVG